MPRTSLSASFFALTTAVGLCSTPASAQQQRAYSSGHQKSPIPLRAYCSPPGAMTLEGSFFTIPLAFNLHVAEYTLAAQWETHFLDRGAGYFAPAIGAPAGPLPSGGVAFNYNGRLIRWDPGVGITFMNNQSPNPSGASPWPYNPTDTACGDSIMIVGNDGKLYARDVAGTNAWTNWGNFGTPFVGKPGLVEHLFTGETHAAVVEQFGRLWIIDDVCGLNGAPTWILAGWGGPNAGLPGGDPLAFCTSVGAGLNGGKFYVTADYWTGAPTDLYEAGPDLGVWGWYNHGHPSWSSGFLSEPTAARDAVLILTQNAATGRVELAYLHYANGSWQPWINLGSPVGDTIVPDTITSEQWANRIVVKGTSGKFWMCRNDGSGWFWYDLDTPM
ncbi:MAG: hypothetical protein JJ916_11745 [Phycisphaerales bacterium]|nr:hypothetical protein [Phycisphaerales bacterium]